MFGKIFRDIILFHFIDSMQFGFISGRGTTDAIFIVRQLQEKYLAKNKELWMAFVNLEDPFDRVLRDFRSTGPCALPGPDPKSNWPHLQETGPVGYPADP